MISAEKKYVVIVICLYLKYGYNYTQFFSFFVAIPYIDDDNGEIHFKTLVVETSPCCMQQQEEEHGHICSGQMPNCKTTIPEKDIGGSFFRKIFETIRNVPKKDALFEPQRTRGSKSKQHRFLEVTDPSLHYIVSQSRVKAVTSEDDIVAQTLKNEAYRVAKAHARRFSKKAGQVFYEEGDVNSATRHSPVHPGFYESKARSAKSQTSVDRGEQ